MRLSQKEYLFLIWNYICEGEDYLVVAVGEKGSLNMAFGGLSS